MRFDDGCDHASTSASALGGRRHVRACCLVVELQEKKKKKKEKEKGKERERARQRPSSRARRQEAAEARMRKKLGTRFPAVRSLPSPISSLAAMIRSERRSPSPSAQRGSSCPAGEIPYAGRCPLTRGPRVFRQRLGFAGSAVVGRVEAPRSWRRGSARARAAGN